MPRAPLNQKLEAGRETSQNQTQSPLAQLRPQQTATVISGVHFGNALTAEQEADILAHTNAQRLFVAQEVLQEATGQLATLTGRHNGAAHVMALLDRAMSILVPLRQSSTPQEDTGICECLNLFNATVSQASKKGFMIDACGIRMLTNITQQ